MAGVSPQKSPVLFFSVSKFLSLLDKILDSTKLLKQLSLLWSILMDVLTALNWWTESNLKKKNIGGLIFLPKELVTLHTCMPSPLAPDPIRVQPCDCCLFWTNNMAVTSIFLEIFTSTETTVFGIVMFIIYLRSSLHSFISFIFARQWFFK